MRIVPTLIAVAMLASGSALAQPAPVTAWRSAPTAGIFLDHNQAMADPGRRVALDASGNVFVAASSRVPGASDSDGSSCAVFLKFGASSGALAWRREACNAGSSTFSGGLAVDSAGDVLVVGTQSRQLYIAKLSGGTGMPVWEHRIASTSPFEGTIHHGLAIGVDAAGNPRVAAVDHVIKVFGLRGADGVVQWERSVPSFGRPRLLGFAVDAAGNSALTDRHDINLREEVDDVVTRIAADGTITWQSEDLTSILGELRMDAAGDVTFRVLNGVQKRAGASGAVLWTSLDGGAFEVAAEGHAFFTDGAPAPGGGFDQRTWRVGNQGSVAWTHVNAEASDAIGVAVAVGPGGHPVTTAQLGTPDGQFQVLTVSHDAASGTVRWRAIEADPSKRLVPSRIVANEHGTVVMAHASDPATGASLGFYLVKYTFAEPVPEPVATVSNMSTRAPVLTGHDVMIGGFVIGGSSSKTVVVRARGPSLAPFGVASPLADPTLQLVRSSDQSTIAFNDDWATAANAEALTASGFAPAEARESALLMSLPPGAYTAIVTGAGGTTGVGIVEVFEVDAPQVPLVNLSTRGRVLTGQDVMIGGFVIQGEAQAVVVRARGPSLAPFGIAEPLANPQLQLVRSSDQATIGFNDDWQAAPDAAQISATGFAPSHDAEAAILVTLPPGAYTAIVTGAGGGTGVGIVEVFKVP